MLFEEATRTLLCGDLFTWPTTTNTVSSPQPLLEARAHQTPPKTDDRAPVDCLRTPAGCRDSRVLRARIAMPSSYPVFALTHTAPRPSIEMDGGTVFHFVAAPPAEVLAIAVEAADGPDV